MPKNTMPPLKTLLKIHAHLYCIVHENHTCVNEAETCSYAMIEYSYYDAPGGYVVCLTVEPSLPMRAFLKGNLTSCTVFVNGVEEVSYLLKLLDI